MNEDDEYTVDDWPTMPDGTSFDGNDVLILVQNGNSPFKGAWDINLVLIQEIENNLKTRVVDIPQVSNGSNNYGFHIKLSNAPDIVARLARGDVNMPNFVGYPFELQGPRAEFEAAIHTLLHLHPVIVVSRLLYYRVPVLYAGPKVSIPNDIAGRRLFLFERTEGEKEVWEELNPDDQMHLLTQCAHIRALLFHLNPPPDFISEWFLKRLFGHKPDVLPMPVAPTREFLVVLLTSKIEATIKNIGDMIGWEEDNATVGPVAFATKQSLLRLIPHIVPKGGDESQLYRLVIDHGDYGIHNMSITKDDNGRPLVSSIYDWEMGTIVPAILSDPTMDVIVTLLADKNAAPSIERLPDEHSPDQHAEYMSWSERYFEVLFDLSPDYQNVIRAGKDVRHLWFTLRGWKGDDAEEFFGELGTWAEKRMKELGAVIDES